MNPSDRGARRRARRGARRRGRGAPERPERAAGRRAGRDAAKPVDVVPISLAPGRAGRARRVRRGSGARPRTPADGARLEAVVTGAVTIASRDIDSNGARLARAATSASSRASRSRPATTSTTSPGAVVDRLLAEPRELLTLSPAGTRLPSGPSWSASARTTRSWSSRRTSGGQPTTSSFWWPNRREFSRGRAVRIVLVEDNDVPGGPRAPARPPLYVEVVARWPTATRRAGRLRASSGRTSPHGLPAARPGRLRGDPRRARRHPRRGSRLPHRRRERARARGPARSAGAVACPKDEPFDAVVEAILLEAATGKVELTSANTAIVLDSTADFPDATERASRTGASCRSTSASATRASATTSSSSPDEFYERLRAAPSCRRPRSRPRPTSPPPTTSCARLRADHLAPHLRAGSRARSRARARRPPELGDAVRVHRLAARPRPRSRCSRSASSAGSRRARPTRTIDAFVERFQREAGLLLHGRHARVPRPRRPDRPGARGWPAQLLQVKPILTIADGEVVPGRPRARQPQGARRARVASSSADRPTAARRMVGIAHADAPERLDGAARARPARPARARGSRSRRRSGAVVGTHAGPGTVGLFWFAELRQLRS